MGDQGFPPLPLWLKDGEGGSFLISTWVLLNRDLSSMLLPGEAKGLVGASLVISEIMAPCWSQYQCYKRESHCMIMIKFSLVSLQSALASSLHCGHQSLAGPIQLIGYHVWHGSSWLEHHPIQNPALLR